MSKVCRNATGCPTAPAQTTAGCPAAETCTRFCEPHGRELSAATGTTRAGRITDINENRPHKVSEVICVKCGRRWISVRPEGTPLKWLECEICGAGYVIETGETMK